MKHKRFQIQYSKKYNARIFKCPDYVEDFDFTLHWHREYEFIYVEKGPLRIHKLDCEIVLNDGDVYFINSEEIHSYVNVTPDLKFTVVNFPVRAIQPYFENPQDVLTFDISCEPARTKIATSLRNLNECKDLEGRLDAMKIKAVLNNACYYLIRDCQKSGLEFIKGGDSSDFECAKIAVLYMEKNYHRDIPLSEISSYVGMTPAHFSKYFKDKTEVTFSKYLRKIRLEHAIADLRQNDVSVKTAALNNGFPNVNSLILTCKSEYGRTPLEMKSYPTA